MASDEDHARMLLEAQERRGDMGSGKSAPAMATWSAEVDMMAKINDTLQGIRHILHAVNSKNPPKPPEPTERPTSAIAKVKREMRQKKHEALAARLLPHKRAR